MRRAPLPGRRARARRLRALSAAPGGPVGARFVGQPTAHPRTTAPREAPPQRLVVLGGLAIIGFVATCTAYQAGALSLRTASALVLAALGAYVWVVVQFARED